MPLLSVLFIWFVEIVHAKAKYSFVFPFFSKCLHMFTLFLPKRKVRVQFCESSKQVLRDLLIV